MRSYGNDLVGWRNAQLDLASCYESRRNRMRCDIQVDLTDYDLQEIKYWFNITDIIQQTAESKAKKVDVDVSSQ